MCTVVKQGIAHSGHAAQDRVGLRLRSFSVRGSREGRWGKLGGGRLQTALHRRKGMRYAPRRARRLWAHAGVGLVERA